MSTIAIIVIFFGLGVLAKKTIVDPSGIVRWLNTFIIYLAVPAIILLKVPQLELSTGMLVPVGFAWLWLLAAWLMVRAVSRWKGWPRQVEGALIILVAMGNTSFLGLPLIQAFFNDAVLGYAIFYDQLGSFLILSTVGIFLVALYASDGSTTAKPGWKKILVSVFTFPPIIALIIALIVPIDNLVAILAGALTVTGTLLMPSALFVLGIQFHARLLPEHRSPLLVGIALKMLVAPVLAVAYLMALDVNYEVRAATIFEAAMPCMITPGLLAINAGIAPRFIATLLGYSTVFAFISLPVVYFFIG